MLQVSRTEREGETREREIDRWKKMEGARGWPREFEGKRERVRLWQRRGDTWGENEARVPRNDTKWPPAQLERMAHGEGEGRRTDIWKEDWETQRKKKVIESKLEDDRQTGRKRRSEKSSINASAYLKGVHQIFCPPVSLNDAAGRTHQMLTAWLSKLLL